MPKVTRTVGDVEYQFDVIPIGVARRMSAQYPDMSDFNVAFISASLIAGGNPNANIEFVDSLPFYGGGFESLLAGAFEANGLRAEKKPVPATGEDVPEPLPNAAVPAMASTSDTSTEA